jgi:hypothetical protein
MSAEERMAASEKGYENGIGAMSAEARMAARKRVTKWASSGRGRTKCNRFFRVSLLFMR